MASKRPSVPEGVLEQWGPAPWAAVREVVWGREGRRERGEGPEEREEGPDEKAEGEEGG